MRRKVISRGSCLLQSEICARTQRDSEAIMLYLQLVIIQAEFM